MNRNPHESRGKTLFSLFTTYFKIGLFTFGGGYAMIALIEEEIVSKRNWITREELSDIITIAESTPGPIAINCSTYVGYKIAGTAGASVATLAVTIPSFVIIYLISLFFGDLLEIPLIRAAFQGIQCAVGLIILRTGWNMARSMPKAALPILCCVFSFLITILNNLLTLGISPILLILLGALIGAIVYLLRSRKGGKQ